MTHLIVLLGLGLNFLGGVLYYVEMFKGRAKPNRVTSALWTVEGAIALAAAWMDGVTWALVPVLMAFLGPLIALILSYVLKQAHWEITFFDKVCGMFSLLAIVFWQMTGDPNIAIFFAILADAAAALPTVVKSWKHPETEALAGYAIPVLGYSTSFFVLEKYSFSEIAFPLWCVFLCGLISVMIATGPARRRVSACRCRPLRTRDAVPDARDGAAAVPFESSEK